MAGRTVIGVGLATIAALGVLLGEAVGQGAAATAKVNVTIGKPAEYRFTLSPAKGVPAGKVTFVIVNKGKLAHSFSIGGTASKVLKPGARTTLTVTFAKAGKFAYRSTVAGDASRGLKGSLSIAAAPSTTTTEPAASGDDNGAGAQFPAGKQVLVTYCGVCHTFRPAGISAKIGPDFGRVGPLAAATVVATVTNGKEGPLGSMPSFAGQLTSDQIQQVASYLAVATGGAH